MFDDITKLQLVDYPKFDDDRGSFIPTAMGEPWQQENVSFSKKGVLRGMHFQGGSAAQTKLVRVLTGSAVDVVIDLRPDSPDFKKVSAFMLRPDDANYLLVPKGFAHGFLALEDDTLFQYRVDNDYAPDAEHIVHWKSAEEEFMKVASEHGLSADDLIVAEKDAESLMADEWLRKGEPVT